MRFGLSHKFSTASFIAVIGTAVIFLTSSIQVVNKYVGEERARCMEQELQYAVSTMQEIYHNSDTIPFVPLSLRKTFESISTYTKSDVYLADPAGRVLIYAENGKCLDNTVYVNTSIIQQTHVIGLFKEMGNMNGLQPSDTLTLGMPVQGANKREIGYVFLSSHIKEMPFIRREIVVAFIIDTLLALGLCFTIFYFFVRKSFRPFRYIYNAIDSFSYGDFSIRVPVDQNDEVGKLGSLFNNMASILSEHEDTRQSFVANVSHELKTPMTTIGGFVDGIIDGTIPPEREKYYLKIVSSEIKRLARLVRSMLNIARLESGEVHLKYRLFDINQVVCSTIFTFENAIEAKQLEVFGLDTDRVMVYADEDLLHQVIYNLVENAVKFANPGGYIELGYRIESHATYISIRNSGEGISKEEIPKVFQRFYKTDQSRSKDKSGVGLGLNIVRSVVTLHNGEVFVQSAKGKFCEFTFSIPTASTDTPGHFSAISHILSAGDRLGRR